MHYVYHLGITKWEGLLPHICEVSWCLPIYLNRNSIGVFLFTSIGNSNYFESFPGSIKNGICTIMMSYEQSWWISYTTSTRSEGYLPGGLIHKEVETQLHTVCNLPFWKADKITCCGPTAQTLVHHTKYVISCAFHFSALFCTEFAWSSLKCICMRDKSHFTYCCIQSA